MNIARCLPLSLKYKDVSFSAPIPATTERNAEFGQQMHLILPCVRIEFAPYRPHITKAKVGQYAVSPGDLASCANRWKVTDRRDGLNI